MAAFDIAGVMIYFCLGALLLVVWYLPRFPQDSQITLETSKSRLMSNMGNNLKREYIGYW